MTQPARALLFYLRRYLDQDPPRRRALTKFYRQRTRRDLNSGNLSRHLALQVDPSLSNGLVYMAYLHGAGELLPLKRRGLFAYRQPKLLHAK